MVDHRVSRPLLSDVHSFMTPTQLIFLSDHDLTLFLNESLLSNLQNPQYFPVFCKIAAVKYCGRFPQMYLVHILVFSVKAVRWIFSFNKDRIRILVVTVL